MRGSVDQVRCEEVAECIWEAAGGWHVGFWLPDWMVDLAAGVLPLLVDDPLVTPYSLAAVRSNSHISHDKAVRDLGFRPRPARQAILDAVGWSQERLGEPDHIPETIARAAA